MADEARQHWWNSLSPREKYLVKAVQKLEEDYQTRTGNYIPVDQHNLNIVMKNIRARENEVGFVLKRMQFYLKLEKTMRDADNLIDDIMNDPRIWGR